MLENFINKVGAVVLAAGKGKRLGAVTVPKVMMPIKGHPLVEFVVNNLEQLGLNPSKICLVVGFKGEVVRSYFGSRVSFVKQTEQLGTGHAVAQAKDCFDEAVETIIVLYGDMPFIKLSSITKLLKNHFDTRATLSLLTVRAEDFEGGRAFLNSFGRIIRNSEGTIIKSVEARDATEAELKVKEVNTCVYCFDRQWLFKNLKNLKNNNIQQEYYLTDLVKMAIDQNKNVSSITVGWEEALGVNTPHDLESAEKLIIN